MQIRLGLPSKGRIARTIETNLKTNNINIIFSNSRCYLGTLSGSSYLEIRLMSAKNIASELASGKLDFGLTGLDLILENKCKHIKLLKKFEQSKAKITILTPLSWTKSINNPFLLRLCMTPILSSKYIQISNCYLNNKNLKQLHLTKSKSTTEINPYINNSNLIIDIISSGLTATNNMLNTIAIISTTTLCMFYNQTSRISYKTLNLINLLCSSLT
ncbi:ATP phosphoribosyltransferase [Candidatus Hodgkinia cicadicola]|uniref:ATP phosphoribosyltransferase n=1 Tax=Candidatus Hodgkinia cicadicola TaxID=573658 RepID=A0ABX4MK24_9HYPH|nr:ATP phosphoribosyltransferase [Candidatus Hodgkinia cicadicola]